jgi:hypothetical protein
MNLTTHPQVLRLRIQLYLYFSCVVPRHWYRQLPAALDVNCSLSAAGKSASIINNWIPFAHKVCIKLNSYLLIPTGTYNIKHFIHTHTHHINEGKLLIEVFHTFQSQEPSNGLWTPNVTRCATFSIEKFNFIQKNIKLKEAKFRLNVFCKYYPKICSDFLVHVKQVTMPKWLQFWVTGKFMFENHSHKTTK